mgnify:CR=1 FL=1
MTQIRNIEKAIGSIHIKSVHWFIFEEITTLNASAGLLLKANIIAIMNSGASEAKGASHWTKINSSIPNSFPAQSSPSANGPAEIKIVYPENTKNNIVIKILYALG